MKVINKALDTINLALAIIAGLFLGFLLASICFATVSRFLFNKPFSNLVEVSAYSLVFVAFLSAPWLLQLKQHIRVDILTNALSRGAQLRLETFANLLGFLICLIVLYVGGKTVIEYQAQGIAVMDSMKTPQWLLLTPIPIGCFFMAVQFVRNTVGDWKLQIAEKRGEAA